MGSITPTYADIVKRSCDTPHLNTGRVFFQPSSTPRKGIIGKNTYARAAAASPATPPAKAAATHAGTAFARTQSPTNSQSKRTLSIDPSASPSHNFQPSKFTSPTAASRTTKAFVKGWMMGKGFITDPTSSSPAVSPIKTPKKPTVDTQRGSIIEMSERQCGQSTTGEYTAYVSPKEGMTSGPHTRMKWTHTQDSLDRGVANNKNRQALFSEIRSKKVDSPH